MYIQFVTIDWTVLSWSVHISVHTLHFDKKLKMKRVSKLKPRGTYAELALLHLNFNNVGGHGFWVGMDSVRERLGHIHFNELTSKASVSQWWMRAHVPLVVYVEWESQVDFKNWNKSNQP